jgi:hypothetical protein
MITGTGVHDQPEWPFTINGMRTFSGWFRRGDAW